MKTYWIGRKQEVDIRLGDDSVSGLHAELVVGDDGRYYLTDCGSANGTRVMREGSWQRLTQGYLQADEKIALGEFKTTVRDLLSRVVTSDQAERSAYLTEGKANLTLPLASTGQRLMTFVLDTLFACIFVVLLALGLASIDMDNLLTNMTTSSLVAVCLLLYYVPQEALCGRTLGKLITGTRAVSVTGGELTFVMALVRTLCRLIFFIVIETFSFLGGNGRPRGWHDRISKTKVVSIRKS